MTINVEGCEASDSVSQCDLDSISYQKQDLQNKVPIISYYFYSALFLKSPIFLCYYLSQ